MASVAYNDIIDGLSGKFGNAVFRTMRGKTFISPAPKKRTTKKQSEAQRSTRVTFRQAAEWAHRTLKEDPEMKAYYQQRAKALNLPNAYTAAVTDYMRKPKIKKTTHADTITYTVTKKGFAVKKVEVKSNPSMGSPSLNTKVIQENGAWSVEYKPVDFSCASITLVINDIALREIKFVDSVTG